MKDVVVTVARVKGKYVATEQGYPCSVGLGSTHLKAYKDLRKQVAACRKACSSRPTPRTRAEFDQLVYRASFTTGFPMLSQDDQVGRGLALLFLTEGEQGAWWAKHGQPGYFT